MPATTDLSRLLGWVKDVMLQCDDMLDLRDDWDAEGSLSPDRETVLAARKFLLALAGHVYATAPEFRMPVPNISPSVGAGVDAHWDDGHERLLMSFRPSPKGVVFDYYGDDRSHRSTKGEFEAGHVPWNGLIYQWFAEWGTRRAV